MSPTKTFGTFFLPGPTEVRDEIMTAMIQPMIPHRGSQFEKLFERLQEGLRLGDEIPVHVTSSATRLGLDGLARDLLHLVPPADALAAEKAAGEDEVAEYRVFRPAAARAIGVERVGAGEYRVTGEAVDRLIARHDVENEEALAHVEQRLRRMGVIAALEAEGFEPGDDVEIGGIVFELDPS